MIFFFCLIKKNPNVIAKEIVLFLKNKIDIVKDYNVIQGFLNIIFKAVVFFLIFTFSLFKAGFKKAL